MISSKNKKVLSTWAKGNNKPQWGDNILCYHNHLLWLDTAGGVLHSIASIYPDKHLVLLSSRSNISGIRKIIKEIEGMHIGRHCITLYVHRPKIESDGDRYACVHKLMRDTKNIIFRTNEEETDAIADNITTAQKLYHAFSDIKDNKNSTLSIIRTMNKWYQMIQKHGMTYTAHHISKKDCQDILKSTSTGKLSICQK